MLQLLPISRCVNGTPVCLCSLPAGRGWRWLGVQDLGDTVPQNREERSFHLSAEPCATLCQPLGTGLPLGHD